MPSPYRRPARRPVEPPAPPGGLVAFRPRLAADASRSCPATAPARRRPASRACPRRRRAASRSMKATLKSWPSHRDAQRHADGDREQPRDHGTSPTPAGARSEPGDEPGHTRPTANGHHTRRNPASPASSWWLRRPISTNSDERRSTSPRAGASHGRSEFVATRQCRRRPWPPSSPSRGPDRRPPALASPADDRARPTTTAPRPPSRPRRANCWSPCEPRCTPPAPTPTRSRPRATGPRTTSSSPRSAALAPGRRGAVGGGRRRRRAPRRRRASGSSIPLDGTREFGEEGRTDWAVHVALWIDGRDRGRRGRAPGPRHHPQRVAAAGRSRLRTTAPPRLVVSRTRPPAIAETLAARLGGELVALGSAGAKAMAVVLGDADVYAHSGGQYEWDSAAPVGVAAAAGLHVSRLDGAPLRVQPARSPTSPTSSSAVPSCATRCSR